MANLFIFDFRTNLRRFTSLIVANLSNHFGMEKVTETKTEKIVSSADSQGADMLLYKA